MGCDTRKSEWSEYYVRTAGRPARPTLFQALRRFDDEPQPEAPRRGIDLGCGDGRDTVELLRRGWSVVAIDAEPGAIDRLLHRPDLPAGADLRAVCANFEDASWPEADLVNASFSLPLCPPEKFDRLWAKILASLKPGGRFAGQLFGDRDGWAGRRHLTFHDGAAVKRLTQELLVEMFEEEETDAVTPYGKPKYWHLFHLVVRRPPTHDRQTRSSVIPA